MVLSPHLAQLVVRLVSDPEARGYSVGLNHPTRHSVPKANQRRVA